MAGQLTVAPPGSMVIDLGKRKKGMPDADSGLDWIGYNRAPHDGPDKDSRGRWKSGHPSVAALGDMPDFVSMLSDEDLSRADEHVGSLVQALAAEKGRRGAEAFAGAVEAGRKERGGRTVAAIFDPAKPLRATGAKKPAKPIPAGLAERVAAIRQRPMSSDVDYLNRELPKLTVAQLEELATSAPNWADTPLPGGSKASKVENTLRRLIGPLSSEAVTHQGSAKGSEYDNEYRRRLKLASDRGDREEYAALVAGFGIGGTGPGLPAERKADRAQQVREDHDAIMSWREPNPAKPDVDTDVSGAGALAAIIANPQTGDQARMTQILGGMKAPEIKALAAKNGVLVSGTKKKMISDFVDVAVDGPLRHHAYMEMGGDQFGAPRPNPSKPLTARKTKPKPVRDRLEALHPDIEPADVSIDQIVAEPEADSREQLTKLLSGMTVPQIQAVLERHRPGEKLQGPNKAKKIQNLVNNLVGSKLDVAAIDRSFKSGANGSSAFGTPDPVKPPAKIPGLARLETKKAKLRAKVEHEESRSRESGRMTQSDAEAGARAELRKVEDEIRALKSRAKAMAEEQELIDATRDPAARALARASADIVRREMERLTKPSTSAVTYLDTPRRTSGDGQFHGNHYHGDGQMGSVIERLKPDQARINVGGKRLDDALADVIIMGHSGERGVSARQVQEWKRIASEVEAVDMDAARRIRGALADIAKPSTFDVDAAILPSTPGPLGDLMRDVNFAAANYFETDAELKVFAEMARKWDIGEMSALQMITDLMYFSPRRHESQEGFFEVQSAAQRAAKALEASGFKKTRRNRPQAD